MRLAKSASLAAADGTFSITDWHGFSIQRFVASGIRAATGLMVAAAVTFDCTAQSVSFKAPAVRPAKVSLKAAATAPAAQDAEGGQAANAGRLVRAQLVPHRYTTIAAEIGAKVNALPFAEGAAFKAGQTLVSFDCAIQSAQLNKARAALDASEFTYKGNQRLMELNSVGRVELDVSRAEVAKNYAEVEGMEALLSKCTITAPFSGRISEQKIRDQQYAQPGQPVLEILDDSVLEVEFIAPSRWLAWLRQGKVFSVRIDETSRTYPAKLVRIAARADPVTQTVKLSGVIDGRFPELLAGMTGMVSFAQPARAR